MDLGIPLVAVKGSYFDMGRQYGEACAKLIRDNVEDYLGRFERDIGLSRGDVDKLGTMFLEVVERYSSEIYDMLMGVAVGVQLEPSMIFALNARTEILYGHGSREDACTSIAIQPSRTANGHTFVSQNWDWHPGQKGLSVLLRTEDESGFVVLSLVEAGMLAKAGVNSSGIALCGNLLVSEKDEVGSGVPYHCIMRGVLQSHSMADALRMATDNERVSSGNILIGDSEGSIIDLELTVGDFGHLLPIDGILAHANHFDSAVEVKDMRKAKSALTLLRPTRARHLLDASKELIGIESLGNVFRDHYSFPNGICRHPDIRDGEDGLVASLYSIIIDVTAREMHIAESPICENEFFRVDLLEPAEQTLRVTS